MAAVAVSMLTSGAVSRASTIPGTQEVFNLNVDTCKCGTGSTLFGKVTLTQDTGGVVAVEVDLVSPTAFVKTGAGNAIVFDLTGVASPTVNVLTTGFTFDGGKFPLKDSPFADGGFSIFCDSACGPGASSPSPGPLNFTVSGGVDITNFSPIDDYNNNNTTTEIYFSADVIGPSGKTGVVGAGPGTTSTPPPVPEPSSLALLGTGALGLAGFVRRKFRRA